MVKIVDAAFGDGKGGSTPTTGPSPDYADMTKGASSFDEALGNVNSMLKF